MKTLIIYSITILSFLQSANAQVAKKIVVEHFTNSVCSVCASRNPGFYTNLNAQSTAIHLAIHPSSPYSSCLLNQHNTSENDARTNYYGIYGATPRLVIQGTVISPNANYSSAAIFTPYLNELSPVQLIVNQQKFGNDSIRSQVIVKTVSTHSLSAASLFIALAEDTLMFAAPNGESMHFDVFRKAISPTTGISLNVPSTVGDSLIYTFTTSANASWNFERIFTLAILQETTSKAVIQSETVLASFNTLVSSINEPRLSTSPFVVFVANGNHNHIEIQKTIDQQATRFVLYDIFGRMVMNEPLDFDRTTFTVDFLNNGFYVYSILNENKVLQSGKLVI
jgi:hypothetical protein